MHRPKPQARERSPAVPADRLGAKQLVLRAARGVGREPGPDAGDRPPVYSRNVLSWRLSNTLTADFCLEAIDAALIKARPEIFNTDQGAQVTATAFTSRLEKNGAAISMDGRGRALDNVFVERLWRTVKYEEVYLRDYADGWQAEKSLGKYFDFYRDERPHQALGNRTPSEVYARGRRDQNVRAQISVETDSERRTIKRNTTRKPRRGRARPLEGVSRATAQ